MNYRKLVPDDTFIGKYMNYMDYVETAQSYDFWCAIWAIGSGVGRDVFVDRPNAPVYLNWYIILVAEAGVTRKSSAISSISNIFDGTCPILAGKTSPENLELYLHDTSAKSGTARAHFAVGELVTILGREGYMSSMPGLLTDLYDCPALRISPGTIRMGEITQRNVYVSFLSGSSPSWLVTAINPSVIEGGFTSRVIFVVDDSRKRAIAWPKAREPMAIDAVKEEYQKTINEAIQVGPIGISKGALSKYTKWYRSRETHFDPFQASFEAREDDHVLRLAACLSINDATYEIQSGHMSHAINIIRESKKRANKIFGEDFSTTARISGAVGRCREILIAAGGDGIRHSDLLRRISRRIDTKELALLMDVLHECGMIQIFKQGKGTIYRATRGIERYGVTSEVLAKLNLR